MFRSTSRARLTIFAATFASVPLLAEQASSEPPAGPGLELIQRSCISCHDIYMITTKRKTPQQWADVMDLMAARGAEVTPEEMQIIEEYLSQNFSAAATGSAAIQQQPASKQ
jgi:mono/diheme cytochrome c family protein